MAGRIRRLNSGSAGIADTARCHGCGHRVRIHNRVGCVDGPCECVVTLAELMPDAPRLEVPDGVESTPAAPPSKPTPPPVAAAPAPAAPPAAAPEPVGEQPAPRPIADVMPMDPAEDATEIAAQVAVIQAMAPKRPRRTPARPAAPALGVERAANGEPDAVEEVAVASTSAAAAHWDPPPASVPLRPDPPPFDFEPFLARALYVSARWYCPTCHHWPLNPGACPGCHKTLQAVYHVTIPRSVA